MKIPHYLSPVVEGKLHGLSMIVLLLMSLMWWAPAQSGDWTYKYGEGKNEPLCHELLKRLNRYARNETYCSSSVMESYPQFTEPPWEELDLHKYKELLLKLMKYTEEGPDGYFHLIPGLKEKFSDANYQYRMKLFIEEGGRLRLLRTRLFNHYGFGPIIPAPPGEQVIVQIFMPMSKKSQDKYCIGKPKPAGFGQWGPLIVVTPDLRGPERGVDPGTYAILRDSYLVMYQGKPLLVRDEDIWREGELTLDRICNFEFVKGKK